MLTTVAVMLVIYWGLGLLSSYTLGGFIHILLLLAIVLYGADSVQRTSSV